MAHPLKLGKGRPGGPGERHADGLPILGLGNHEQPPFQIHLLPGESQEAPPAL